jgi:3-phosphoshikimate 1-carboxyvinyltransferase
MSITKKIYRIIPGYDSKNISIILPSSKSISNRVQIINALSYSPWPVENLSDSDDTQVLADALNSNDHLFDIGHAGTAMRFLTAFLSKIAGEWIITGSERMQQRPIRILVDALRNLGAQIEYLGNEGYPPLRIFGSHLKGGILEVDGSISSQYISALLMIAPTLEGGLTLRVTNRLISMSYIEMTLKLMKIFGITYHWENNEIVIPGQEYKPVGFTVEADWSAASYWYEVLALSNSGKISMTGLRLSGLQGDEAVAKWFTWFGVETVQEESGIVIRKKNNDRPSRLNLAFNETPDMAQTMAALCVAKKVPFHFTGLETLKIKETNRIEALQKELAKFGAWLTEPGEGELQWDGQILSRNVIPDPVIETYHDHRMALAFAPLAMGCPGLRISDPDVITKSYPAFWNDLRLAGFVIDEENG